MLDFNPQTFFVVIDGFNKIVWREIGRTQGENYGCVYKSKAWAEKKAKSVNGFVYSVQGLYFPNFNSESEADHDKVAKETPFFK